MKNLFTFIFICICFVSNAQTTTISDTNFEQFLVDQGIDTNGVNGNILNADAQAVTNLNITRNDIVDFTGLEAFVNVTTLNLGNNLFTDLPLNNLVLLEELVFNNNTVLANLDLSTNVNLKIIDMRANGGVNAAPITTIDFSANINLTSIHVYNFGDLENFILPNTTTLNNLNIYSRHNLTIDLGVFDNLETLSLGVGASSVINVTLPIVKTSLTYFRLFNGAIPTIDLSSFVALETIDFTGTGVVTFIPPQTTTLTDVKIQIHNISSVSFNGAPNLKNLTIRNGNPTSLQFLDITDNLLLETLTLVNNKMTNVDITKNTELFSLDISDNDLTTINTEQNDKLVSLNAKDNLITNLDLSTNILLKSILLGENKLPNLDVTANILLEDLEIDNNLFTTTGLDLTQNTELEDFTASFNQIESLDISQNSKLKKLIIDNNLFSGNDILKEYYQNFINSGRFISGSYELIVHHNNLTGLIPDFSTIVNNNTHRFILEIEDNNFHFEDFETVHDQYLYFLNNHSPNYSNSFFNYFNTYNYAGQKKVNPIENLTPNAGDDITLTTTVRGSQNHYKWYKDGVEIIDAPDAPEYTITDLNTCDNGVYYSEITSDLIPFENSNPPGTNGKNLLLVRNNITLTVNATKECVTLDMPLTNVPINSGVQWNDTPGACGYKISVGTTSGATDVVNNEDVRDVTVYNFDSDLDPNEDYFVTITPYYDDGDFTCTEQSFSTNSSTISPDCTSLSSPFNIESNVAADLSRIEWNPANGADEYNITISSPSSANDITTNTTETFLTLSNDFNTGEIVTVTIVPENNIGSASGCTPETFTITNTSIIIPSGNQFISTWETTTVNETITIPTFAGETYNYTVDWGDATTTSETGNATHSYAMPGIHTIKITGNFPRIHFDNNAVDREKLLTIEQWGDIEWTSMEGAFYGCSNLQGNFTDAPDLTLVTNMSNMFADCTSFNTDLNNWDVSKTTNMRAMFNNARAFNGNISDWDVGEVTLMNSMFLFASSFNSDIGNWNVSNVINMDSMLADARAFNQDIGNWDVSAVVSTRNMFLGCSLFNQDIGSWEVDNVTDMSTMFQGASVFNQDISDWNVSKVTTTNMMFLGARAFNQDIGSWNFSSLTIASRMFDGARNFNQDIADWNMSSVKTVSQMFHNATTFDQDISNWTVENITSADNMFEGVTLSTANYDALLIGWNAQNLQSNVNFSGGNSKYCSQVAEDARANMIASNTWIINDGGKESGMACATSRPFITTWQTTTINEDIIIPTTGGGYNYTVDWGDTTTSTVETGDATHTYAMPGVYTVTITGLFPRIYFNTNGNPTATDNSTKILTIEQWGTNPWTSMSNAFTGCINLTGNFSDIPDLSNVTSTKGMFATCRLFNSNIDNWNMSNVTDMAFMFQNNRSFNQPLNSWDVSNVTNMSLLFQGAIIFNQPLDNWDVSNVTNLSAAFSPANAFDQNIGSWNVEKVTDASNMFNGSALSTANYDALLIGWNARDLQPNVTFSGGNSQYCEGESARTNMINSDFWTITDRGIAGPTVTDLANQTHVDSYTLPTITGTQLTGSEAYYTETDGGGTSYDAGDVINFTDFTSYPVTLYIYDGTGSCANEKSFELTLTENTPTAPNCTTLATPRNKATNVATTLNQITWDAIANATAYKVTITGTTNNNRPEFETTDTHVDFTMPFLNDEVVSVSIIPINGTVEATGCTIQNFTIEAANTTPTTPVCATLSTPANRGTGVSVNRASVSWEPVANADGYLITVSGTADNNVSNFDVTTGTSYNFANDFTHEEVVNIKIEPYNSAGVNTTCNAQSFTIIEFPTTPPPCTSISSPANGATNISPNITSVSWPPIANASGYDVTVTGTANNNVSSIDVPRGTTYMFQNDFLYGETVNVNIIPYNAFGRPLFNCPTVSFTIANDPNTSTPTTPVCATLATPINEATNVATTLNQITWGPIANATAYKVTITGSANNNRPEFETTDTHVDFTMPFLNDEVVSVSIIPINGTIEATGCTIQSFTIEAANTTPTVPDCTLLSTPTNEATNVATNTTIEWETIDNADGYFLEIVTVAGDVLLEKQDVSILTSYTPPNLLPENTEIIVRVTPYSNDLGEATNCSENIFRTSASQKYNVKHGFSPDGDGINDYWEIEGIENHPNNIVSIYNRWGDMVFQVQGYNNTSTVFSGVANQKTKMGANILPEGTYFYKFTISEPHNFNTLKGYVVIKR